MENKELVGKALGKVASGLYVVTSKNGNDLVGFTASFLVQVAFEPPIVAVSMKKGRASFDAIMSRKEFVVNIMTKDTMKLVGAFANPKNETPFDGVAMTEKTLGLPVLTDSLAYLECKVHSTSEVGDHVVVFGEIVNGDLLKEDGEPATHVRKNGFSY
ncbi:MAG: flavin reductase family protein [Candidatus Sericytochromatia bacterium]